MVATEAAAGLTTGISAVLTGRLASTSLTRRHVPSGWWAGAFGLATIAAGLQLIALLHGSFQPEWAYRVYLFTAALTPGVMGTGSAYLLGRTSWARACAVAVGIFTVVALIGAVTASLHVTVLNDPFMAATSVAKVTTSPLMTIAFAGLGTIGGGVMIIGSAVSYIRTRSLNALYIFIGGTLFSAAGTSAALGVPFVFFADQAIGVLFLYAGAVFRRTTTTASVTQSPA